MNDTIIIHEGTVCLLSKPEEANGQLYHNGFDAETPELKSWAFMLRPSRNPDALTDDKLIAALKKGPPELNAKWEEVPGYTIGWVTICFRKADGSTQDCRVQYEQGPEIPPPGLTSDDYPPLKPALPEDFEKLMPPKQVPKNEIQKKIKHDPFDML